MRRPTMKDCQFLLECYEDWPVTETQGPVTMEDVKRFVNVWMNERRDGAGLINYALMNEFGLIAWRQNYFAAAVDNLIIHPSHRRGGHGRRMWEYLDQKLRSEGILVAEYDAYVDLPIGQEIGQTMGNTGLMKRKRVT